MKKSPPSPLPRPFASPTPGTPVSPLNVRRRHQIAATAAALSLAGCGMFSQPAAAPSSPQQLEAERKVKAYQSDIESALDKVDQERLRAAAAQKNNVQVIAPTATSPAQVILASATGAAPTNAVAPVPAAKSSAGGPATPAAPTIPAAPVVSVAPSAGDASTRPATPTAAAASAPGVGAAAVAPAVASTGTPASSPPAIATISPAHTAASESNPLSVPPTATGVVGENNAGVGGMGGVVVAPLSGDAAVPSAVIAPFTPPATPGASAMGAMTATAAPNQAVSADPLAAPAAPVEISADQAVEALRKTVGEHPTLNTALALALLDGDKSGEALKKLSDTDQKLVTDLLGALDAMKARANAPTLAERAAPLLDAAQGWRDTADLTLPRLVLATRVDSFGVFTPITGNFEQGKRHTVIIYCEVANFRSVKGDDGWYTTKLSQQETLFTEDNLLVWRPNAEDVEDRSLNQRHDFYLVKKLTLPETLAAGKYTLRMSVTDRTANKIKIVEMPLEIVAKDAAGATPSVTSAAK